MISSTGYFSEKKYNDCIVSFKDNKVYNVMYDNEGNSKYEYYKDLSNEQRNLLINYINENDLLNVLIDNFIVDVSDIIEISFNGKKI